MKDLWCKINEEISAFIYGMLLPSTERIIAIYSFCMGVNEALLLTVTEEYKFT